MNLSFGEILVLALIALVVIGPKELAPLLRKTGRFLGQARRTMHDMRRETGLDEIIQGDLRDLERLADHIEGQKPTTTSTYTSSYKEGLQPYSAPNFDEPIDQEYPSMGADSTHILPEDSLVYATPKPDSATLETLSSNQKTSITNTTEPTVNTASSPPIETT